MKGGILQTVSKSPIVITVLEGNLIIKYKKGVNTSPQQRAATSWLSVRMDQGTYACKMLPEVFLCNSDKPDRA